MKKYTLFLSIILAAGVIFMGQSSKSTDEDNPRWIIPQPRTGDVIPPPIVDNYVHPVTEPWVVETSGGSFIVSPNMRVHPNGITTQTEVILVSHPSNPNILYGSSNAAKLTGGSFINEGVYVSTNGGLNWTGSDTMSAPNLNDQRGDPGPTIDKNGRFIQTHLTSATNFGGVTGMGANYSTNNGLTWSSTFQVSLSSNDDKNLACSDNVPSSPFYGNSYMTWCRFSGGTSGNSMFSRTTDGGVSWSSPLQINTTPAGHFAQGNDVRVGPAGQVYCVWVAESSSSPFPADFMGFAKSTNGGLNFTTTENAVDMNGSRSASFGGWGTRVNDFVRMDVDVTGGPRNGWIYVVNTQNSLAPAGSDPDVILSRSTDGGTTWTKHRVNQDPINNGKLQWFPVVEVDDGGAVNVVYYDNRNFSPADSCAIFISRSLDGGNTFTDFEITDHHFKPLPAPGFSGGYYGDYMGLTSSGGKLHAFWMDNTSGIYNAWYCNVTVANNPLNAFNLQSPAPGVTVNSLPGSSSTVTFNWDTSATGASYKWIFGSPTTTPRLIQQPAGTNSLTMTLGQLDVILAGLGLSPGQQLVGQWDVWATRPNPPANDSLKAANGPRAITLRRGIPTLSPFSLVSPPTNTTITTSIFNSSNVGFRWRKSGDGTTYKFKFGSPSLGSQQISLGSDNSGNDTNFTRTNAQLDGILANLGVAPGDSLVGQWAAYAYNGVDSLKSVETWNLTFKRSSVTALFYDDFATGTGKWTITNDGGTCVWQTFSTPYPNTYTLPATSQSPVLSADEDECGSGTSMLSTITVLNNINCSGYQNIVLEWDNDWRILDGKDIARVQASYDGGSTWSTVVEWVGVAQRNTHEVKPLPLATNIPNLKIRLVSIQPGWDWWWTVDNVTVKGDVLVGLTQNGSLIPTKYDLYQNYPNPFNPSTKIKFDLPKQSVVTLKIYDIAGREVTRLINSQQYNAGAYSYEFNAANLASGVYFYRLEAGEFVEIKKMMLIK